MGSRKLSAVIAFIMAALAVEASAQTPPPFDSEQANGFFEKARELSDKDGGRLWGKRLYGPILFVDYENRRVIANQQDGGGLLRQNGKVFEGKLADEVPLANTSMEWSGTRWTMMIWQMIPEDRLTREKMFAHEMFHRIQGDLKLMPQDKLNLHLDTMEGRVWLHLEWRALAKALIEEGAVQSQAIKDALLFRNHRQKLYSESSENERSLEIAEGVPEYTGLVAAAPDLSSARWSAASKLANPDLTLSFVRSFAYTSGPAYGLLLDQRLPRWKSKLTAQSDLGKLLASTMKGNSRNADSRAIAFGAAAIRNAEQDRQNKIENTKARYRKFLIEGPTLKLPGSEDMNFTFNPSTIISLDDAGAVYPTLQVVAPWGRLEVTGGALRPKGSGEVIVAAPSKTADPDIEGPGWRLKLNKGWRVAPISASKNLTVQKN